MWRLSTLVFHYSIVKSHGPNKVWNFGSCPCQMMVLSVILIVASTRAPFRFLYQIFQLLMESDATKEAETKGKVVIQSRRMNRRNFGKPRP